MNLLKKLIKYEVFMMIFEERASIKGIRKKCMINFILWGTSGFRRTGYNQRAPVIHSIEIFFWEQNIPSRKEGIFRAIPTNVYDIIFFINKTFIFLSWVFLQRVITLFARLAYSVWKNFPTRTSVNVHFDNFTR